MYRTTKTDFDIQQFGGIAVNITTAVWYLFRRSLSRNFRN